MSVNSQVKEEFEEGTEILDPELKAKQEIAEKEQAIKTEEMRAVNLDIVGALKDISERHGMKLYIAGYSPKHDEMGIWKSSNVSQFDEMGLVKLLEGQF